MPLNPNQRQTVDSSPDMHHLRQVLDKFWDAAVKHIHNADTERQALDRAKRMETGMRAMLPYSLKCPPGTTWDADTGTCI